MAGAGGCRPPGLAGGWVAGWLVAGGWWLARGWVGGWPRGGGWVQASFTGANRHQAALAEIRATVADKDVSSKTTHTQPLAARGAARALGGPTAARRVSVSLFLTPAALFDHYRVC